ncbi:hypothetical protein PR003_g16874 [Phytophthora rubi]|uniref:Uncharacterized protein n=1 Tax=Phytophthora rubi TaxID=129364 RepID=A0A6A3KG24_9STRA|nr:hypothetical protein PR002_g16505 [Phytophthora rubi]KAE9011511.1 hypothetical protein PR001_g15893 [Phytophthora rubi]KAE9323856.1 hypothetical protein PR003_g16874 [Phytophthora rubi]
MAAAVGDLFEQLGRNDSLQRSNGMSFHPADDDEGLGRSYVCSMPSAIDLGCHESGNCADLAVSIQHYLARIVEELHLISAWSSSIYHRQQPRTDTNPVSIDGGKRIDDSSFTAMARLAVVTDIELLRRDVTKAQHELFQRCTTQMAYVQNEASAAISKQDMLVDELQQRMEDTQHACDQQAQAVQALEKARAESDGQIRSMATALRQVQQQVAAHPARMSELEKSLATLTSAQFSHEQELQALQRRAESYETAHQLQLENSRRTAEDSLTASRSAYSQLSAKMQVLRLELQELSESTQKRMQQMLKAVSSVATTMSGKATLGPGAAVPPRRPSVATPRTPRSGGNTASSELSQNAGPVNSSDTREDILGGAGSTQMVMATGADAMRTNDCFIYAKAALPHRNSIADMNLSTKKPVAPSTGSNRADGGSSASSGAAEKDVMSDLLKVQQSVMSLPLGFEDDTRPATAFDPAKGNMNAMDRRDPIIPTRRTAPRHNSLPDVNLSAALSPHKFQASRLNTKQK